MVPPPLDEWKETVNVLAGAAELGGGLAIIPQRTRRGARWWLLTTLVAVYPANIHMALHPERFPKFRKGLLSRSRASSPGSPGAALNRFLFAQGTTRHGRNEMRRARART
jgi:hypothetical protein